MDDDSLEVCRESRPPKVVRWRGHICVVRLTKVRSDYSAVVQESGSHTEAIEMRYYTDALIVADIVVTL